MVSPHRCCLIFMHVTQMEIGRFYVQYHENNFSELCYKFDPNKNLVIIKPIYL